MCNGDESEIGHLQDVTLQEWRRLFEDLLNAQKQRAREIRAVAREDQHRQMLIQEARRAALEKR
jgi:hypothetical protein